MKRESINSTSIRRIGFEPITETAGLGTLEIEFEDTGLYRYLAVPQATFAAFKATPSPGKFFAANINKTPMGRIRALQGVRSGCLFWVLTCLAFPLY